MANEENIRGHQFPPGTSGNPAGRPKGSRNLATILRGMLEEEVDVKVEGQAPVKKPFNEVILRRLLKKAADGDTKAIKEIFDRVDGKAQQFIDLSSGGEPITQTEHTHTHEVVFRSYTKAKPGKARPKKKGREKDSPPDSTQPTKQ